jgi:hypothetical protein
VLLSRSASRRAVRQNGDGILTVLVPAPQFTNASELLEATTELRDNVSGEPDVTVPVGL